MTEESPFESDSDLEASSGPFCLHGISGAEFCNEGGCSCPNFRDDPS